ncbi:carboxylate--amine ligase [Aurantivibrio plasticivorans]
MSNAFSHFIHSSTAKNDLPTAVILGKNVNSDDMLLSLNKLGIDTVVVKLTLEVKDDYGENTYDNPMLIALANQLIQYLNLHIEQNKKSIIFSSEDIYSVLLAFSETELDTRFHCVTPSKDIVKICANKIKFFEYCEAQGIDIPATHVFYNKKDIDAVTNQLKLPGIVRPHYSGALPKSIVPKVLMINTIAELHALGEKVFELGQPVFYQEFIPGDSTSTWFLGGFFGVDGKPSDSYFVGQKLLEHPLIGGNTTLARMRWNDPIVENGLQFIQAINYSGLADIEFKFDHRDQKYKIIEVNPRIGRWHSISQSAKTDIIREFYLTLLGMQTAPYSLHQEGRVWMAPVPAFCSYIESKGLFVGITHWLRAIFKADIKAGVDLRKLRQTMHQLRAIQGHIRSLSFKELLRGCKQ